MLLSVKDTFPNWDICKKRAIQSFWQVKEPSSFYSAEDQRYNGVLAYIWVDFFSQYKMQTYYVVKNILKRH